MKFVQKIKSETHRSQIRSKIASLGSVGSACLLQPGVEKEEEEEEEEDKEAEEKPSVYVPFEERQVDVDSVQVLANVSNLTDEQSIVRTQLEESQDSADYKRELKQQPSPNDVRAVFGEFDDGGPLDESLKLVNADDLEDFVFPTENNYFAMQKQKQRQNNANVVKSSSPNAAESTNTGSTDTTTDSHSAQTDVATPPREIQQDDSISTLPLPPLLPKLHLNLGWASPTKPQKTKSCIVDEFPGINNSMDHNPQSISQYNESKSSHGSPVRSISLFRDPLRSEKTALFRRKQAASPKKPWAPKSSPNRIPREMVTSLIKEKSDIPVRSDDPNWFSAVSFEDHEWKVHSQLVAKAKNMDTPPSGSKKSTPKMHGGRRDETNKVNSASMAPKSKQSLEKHMLPITEISCPSPMVLRKQYTPPGLYCAGTAEFDQF
jgi:hypothetical protein